MARAAVTNRASHVAPTAGAKSLVGTLVRLQLKLFWRYTKSSTSMLVGSLIMLLMVLGAAIPMMWGLVALRGVTLDQRGAGLTLGFALLTLGWPLTVTLATGNNDMLDAGRFALLPVRVARLLPGLLVSACLGLGGLLTLLLGVGYVVAWSGSVTTFVAAVVGLVLGFATCVVSSRALSSLLAGVLRRRKARDLVMVVFVVMIFAFSAGTQFLSRWLAGKGNGPSVDVGGLLNSMIASGRVVAATPFGWAWALPWAAGQGSWLTALFLLASLAWLGFLAWVWGRQFGESLISPLEVSGGAQKIRRANPLDRLMPKGPAGAIAKRDLRYWRRDPRRLIGAIAMLIMPFLMAFPMALGGQGVPGGKTILAFAPALMAWMAALYVGFDISYDGSALATQIVTGASGRDDRWGRLLAFGAIFGVVQVVFVFGFMIFAGRWDLLPATFGLSAAMFLVNLGVGSWMGSIWQIRQPPAGSSLITRNGAGGVGAFVSSLVGMFLPIAMCTPVIVLAVLAAVRSPLYGWIALAVGIIEGALVVWWGVASGGRRLDQRWPEVLEKVTWKG